MEEPRKRVVVIGAGAVGLSSALYLQRDGHRVTLIERDEPGAGTSFGNAGIIALASTLPVGTPGIAWQIPSMLLAENGPFSIRWLDSLWMLPWLARFLPATRRERVREISRAIRALTDRAKAPWEALLQRTGAGELVRWAGWLKLAETEEEWRKLELEQQALLAHEVPHEIVDPATISEMEPALAPLFVRGLWVKENGQIDRPKQALDRFAGTFASEGGTILKTLVKTVIPAESGRHVIVTDQGTHYADAVVLAAGPWSASLARSLGCRVPLVAERGYHLMLPQEASLLQRPIYSQRFGYVLAPMGPYLRLTHGAEFASLDAAPDETRVRALVADASRLLPGMRTDVETSWMGRRPSTPDSLPVLGPAPCSESIILAYGHGHIGLTLGPLSGRIVADLVAGRDPGINLAPYSPLR